MSRAELTTTVTCIFWRSDDDWRGECVEFAAQAAGRDLDEVQQKLVTECYRVGEEALDRGQLPVRHPDEVSEEARQHLDAVLKDGASVPLDECRGQHSHVLVHFDIKLQRSVSDLDDDLGTFRFVFLHSGDLWVAQCLEYDLGGEGESPRAAADAAVDAIMTQVAMDRMLGKPALSAIPQAPERYQRLFEHGVPIDIEKRDIEGTFRVAHAA